MLAEPQTTETSAAAADAADAAIHAAASFEPKRGLTPFGAAVLRWKAQAAATQALYDADPEDDDAYEAASAETDTALNELLQTRADGVAEIAEKGRIFIDAFLGGRRYPGANADNPAYLSHLMAEGWAEHALISLFQDAAGLSGAPPELCEARVARFSASKWLSDHVVSKGARFHWDNTGGGKLTFGGPGEAEANIAFEALPAWNKDEVRASLRRTSAGIARQAEMPRWMAPTGTANMIRVFADMAAYNAEPTDSDKQANLRRRLRESLRREIGLPVGVPNFDPRSFTRAAYEAGMRFQLVNPDFGPEVLQRPNDKRPETTVVSNLFAQLDGEQIKALTAYLLKRRAWAESWVQSVEQETGCLITFHDGGIGFGVGPDDAGSLADASRLFNGLSKDEAMDLRAYAAAKAAGDGPANDKAMAK